MVCPKSGHTLAGLIPRPRAFRNSFSADLARADRAVHRWFPDAPGRVSGVRFAHSPGWFDPAYLNSLRSFDAVFALELDDGSLVISFLLVIPGIRDKGLRILGLAASCNDYACQHGKDQQVQELYFYCCYFG